MHGLDEFGLCAATIVRLHAVNHIDDRLINIERSIFQTRILTQMIWVKSILHIVSSVKTSPFMTMRHLV